MNFKALHVRAKVRTVWVFNTEDAMRKIQYLLLAAFMSPSIIAVAEVDERIRVFIEEPVEGGSYSGISNLRGWVVGPHELAQPLEVRIDGEKVFDLPVGGERADVGNAYPDYPDSDRAGFSMAFNYKDLLPGVHEITVRADDIKGKFNEAVVSFETERFETAFIGDASEVDLTTTEPVTAVDSTTYQVRGATLEGKKWDFFLSWDNASQAFRISEIGASQKVEQPTNPGGEPSSEAFPFPNGLERLINDRSQFVNLGSAAGVGNVQYIEINQGLVPVLGMTMSVNGPSVGRISFGPTALWPASPIDLRLWISETPDGQRVSSDCSYSGFAEATLRVSTDGSELCNLADGVAYYLNLALCTVDDDDYYTDWNCTSVGAQTADSDARLAIQSSW